MFPRYAINHLAEQMKQADGAYASRQSAQPKVLTHNATGREQREERLRLGAWLAALTAAAVGVIWLVN